MMNLLLFHFRVGVRVAIRASPPLVCGIVAAVMFQDSPMALVAAAARWTFSNHWTLDAVLPVAAIAFLLPAWAKPKLSEGLGGWIRHLPISDASHRRGLFLALASVQLPLIVMLGLLALTAKGMGLPVVLPVVRWVLVALAGAAANLPVGRRILIVPLSVLAAAVPLRDGGQYSFLSLPLFLAIDGLAGPLQCVRRSTTWRDSGLFLNWRLAWRALGVRIPAALLLGVAPIGASWLFISNNHLHGATASAAARLGGVVGSVFCLSTISKHLAVRRPVWPLARSFPWSSTRRIAEDSVFVGVCAMPLVLLVADQSIAAALMVMTVVPLISIRAAEFIRRIPGTRSAALAFFGEGVFIAIVLTLLPWSALLWVAGTIPALYSARECERSRKSTAWVELDHATAGDTSSWSA